MAPPPHSEAENPAQALEEPARVAAGLRPRRLVRRRPLRRLGLVGQHELAPDLGRQAAAVPKQPGEAQGEAKDEGTSLWTAGLKALDSVRQDAARRHASVIESLLGIVPAARRGCDDDPEAARGVFPSLDTFGLRKFEDVFDQRVAATL